MRLLSKLVIMHRESGKYMLGTSRFHGEDRKEGDAGAFTVSGE